MQDIQYNILLAAESKRWSVHLKEWRKGGIENGKFLAIKILGYICQQHHQAGGYLKKDKRVELSECE